MPKTLNDDVVMTERCLRVEAQHVEGPDGGLCYVAAYTTNAAGQWALVADWSFDALGEADDPSQCEAVLREWLHLLF